MKLNRIIAVLVFICIYFSGHAYAEFSDINIDFKYYEAVETLAELGIVNGYEDATFRPDVKVTRAEFTKLIVSMAADGDFYNRTSVFTDVANTHWAAGYITKAFEMSMVNGVGNNMFKPENEITYDEAVKIIVSLLGYADNADKLGGYPAGYILTANQKGITNGTLAVSDGITRGVCAKLIYNALTTPMASNETILYNRMGAIRAEAQIIGLSGDDVLFSYKNIDAFSEANGWRIENIPANIATNGRGFFNRLGSVVNAYIDIRDASSLKLITVVLSKNSGKELLIKAPLLIDSNHDGYVAYYKTETDDIPTKSKLSDDLKIYNGTLKDIVNEDNENVYKYIDADGDDIYDTVIILYH